MILYCSFENSLLCIDPSITPKITSTYFGMNLIHTQCYFMKFLSVLLKQNITSRQAFINFTA